MRKKLRILFFAFVGAGLALSIQNYFFKPKQDKTIIEKQASHFASDFQKLSGLQLDFKEVAKRAKPAVVHIKTTLKSSPSNGFEGFGNPFELFDPRFRQQGPQVASGSGVFITADGFIATNNHVVDNASKIEVVLDDKRSYEADLIGSDPETDLALLKIEEKGLNFLAFGNSDDLEIGEWVIAVGNPFNLTSTITAGIVSAKGRNINLLRQNGGEWAIENFIQTDAAVNPGNSGGALVNTKGELVGINTAIASKTGSYAGYSFAVPVNIAKKILDDLLKFGEVKRAVLGVKIQDLTAELAEEKGIDKLEGVYVPEVIEGQAADKAGIKSGDVILKIDDKPLNSSSQLQEEISKHYPGDEIEIFLLRGGKKLMKKAKLLTREGEEKFSKEVSRDVREVIGATFENLSREEQLAMGVRNGVRLKKSGDSEFKAKGITEGFVITKIDKQKVNTTEQLEKMLKGKKGFVFIEGVKSNGSEDAYVLQLN